MTLFDFTFPVVTWARLIDTCNRLLKTYKSRDADFKYRLVFILIYFIYKYFGPKMKTTVFVGELNCGFSLSFNLCFDKYTKISLVTGWFIGKGRCFFAIFLSNLYIFQVNKLKISKGSCLHSPSHHLKHIHQLNVTNIQN